MAILGRLHVILLHFPLALVTVAAGAELAAMVTRAPLWRSVAVVNVRIGAVLAVAAACSGWWLASTLDPTPLLAWHRAAGLAAALATIAAALWSFGIAAPRSTSSALFRLVLFGSAALVIVAGHLGGSLVWGVNFLRP